MAKASLATTLNHHSLVGLDSMLFIYHAERHPDYLPLTRIVFKRIETGKNKGVTSVLSLSEVLTLPYGKARNDLAVLYRGLLADFPHLELASFDREAAELSASLRAHYSIATPDAIQLATALQLKATAFLTNDKQLVRIKELDIILLDDYRS